MALILNGNGLSNGRGSRAHSSDHFWWPAFVGNVVFVKGDRRSTGKIVRVVRGRDF